MQTIYAYIDYREYLDAWFTKKKESNPRYSHRLFSRLMAQRSPGFLRDIVQNRRNLTSGQQERLCKVMGLAEEEERYLSAMITLDQSREEDARKRAYEWLLAARHYHNARTIEGESYLYLSNWYCPAIRELSLRPDFVADAVWICGHLCPTITLEQAEEALEILVNLDMLAIHPDKSVTTKEGSLVTPTQVSGMAVHNYHRQMLKLASEGIDRFSPEDRHYMGITVCIPPNMFPLLKQKINDFTAQLLEQCEVDLKGEAEAVQINMHCFPLSRKHAEGEV
jgi:uncharacterized protein (TIGR02147 family)